MVEKVKSVTGNYVQVFSPLDFIPKGFSDHRWVDIVIPQTGIDSTGTGSVSVPLLLRGTGRNIELVFSDHKLQLFGKTTYELNCKSDRRYKV